MVKWRLRNTFVRHILNIFNTPPEMHKIFECIHSVVTQHTKVLPSPANQSSLTKRNTFEKWEWLTLTILQWSPWFFKISEDKVFLFLWWALDANFYNWELIFQITAHFLDVFFWMKNVTVLKNSLGFFRQKCTYGAFSASTDPHQNVGVLIQGKIRWTWHLLMIASWVLFFFVHVNDFQRDSTILFRFFQREGT